MANIKSILCVTYIPWLQSVSNSGFYINIYPWVSWKKVRPVRISAVKDGPKARVLTEGQRKLRAKHKRTENKEYANFEKL